MNDTAESKRLSEAQNNIAWKKWGPYLSERQWGTVREDYSADGNAWNYFSHDQSRSRAYRWGEDGLAGISDDKQRLCFALALWNGKDPIIKERLFGLTNGEGNHGEDVKEYYFYLDSTPTHSYMKYLYKYPQGAYPYDDLVATNRQRDRDQFEYELLETGAFNDNRYFDVFAEYAKETPEDILIRITVSNRGTEPASLHVLPTLWFRNTWSWSPNEPKPSARQVQSPPGVTAIMAAHPTLGDRFLYCEGDIPLLFTENETNSKRLFGTANRTPYVKDGINNTIVYGMSGATNPEKTGTKVSPHYQITIDAGGTSIIRLRLSNVPPADLGKAYRANKGNPFQAHFDVVLARRAREADEFYASIIPETVDGDKARVMRQALAGMLWSKQHYSYDGYAWLGDHHADPFAPDAHEARNAHWFHMINNDVISMPDKWEYPWYAAWDLAFHTIALSLVDIDFAKQQLDLLLQSLYLHPSGQVPAYEWNFGDVNPPVHAWAALSLYNFEKTVRGKGDIEFLKRVFKKLTLNFTWWLNRKDHNGKNLFEGGFLGLDNIGVFDRGATLPTGGHLEQADGTGWMALFSQNMAEISIELASHDPTYEEFALKFVEHFIWIATATNRMGKGGLWDEEDGFYYDILRLPDGTAHPLKVRSMVGLLPLCATTVIEEYQRERVPNALRHLGELLHHMPEITRSIHTTGAGQRGVNERGILGLVNQERLRRILSRMLDEEEFLSPYGIRALSRYHAKHPYVINVQGQEYRVGYLPAESNSGLFGGNSNWRGPIWMPINALIIRALLQFYLYYGDSFRIECPTRSGKMMNLFEVGREIADRLTRIFTRDQYGRRPIYGATEKFQNDPYWRDYILFYEYFHGDNGAGLGASHQTGWTGLVAPLIHMFDRLSAESYLMGGKLAVFEDSRRTAEVARKTAA